MPRIFVASDIQWTWAPSLPPTSEYHHIILDAKPDYVFLLGDIIADGFDHKDNSAALLRMVTALGKPTYILFGNNDYAFPAAISRVKERLALSKHARVLKQELFTLDGLSCLAVDHRGADNVRNLKALNKSLQGHRLDIVFSHVPNKRKPWLLLLGPRLLITGHFGPGVMQVKETSIISSDRFPYNYYIIDLEVSGGKLSGVRIQEHAPVKSTTYERLKESSRNTFELLLDGRAEYERLGAAERAMLLNGLKERGVPHALLSEFVTRGKETRVGKAIKDRAIDDFAQRSARASATAHKRTGR